MTNNRSDRIAGIIMLVVAIWYIIESTTLVAPMMVDNLGPGAFPMFLGIILIVCSIYLIVRPDADPEWPSAIAWGRMALITLSFVIYAYIMEPLGFIITTTFEMIVLGYIFKGPPLLTPAISLIFTLALFALFSYVLGLSLPVGDLIEPYL